MKEVWKEIKDYEGYYEVSNFGRFRSMDRVITYSNGRKAFYKGRIIKGNIDKDGYINVKLSKDGITKTRKLHRLIAQTFIPIENSNDLEINHIDYDRTNNKIDNLEWVTHIDNVQHSSKEGHYEGATEGCKNGRANYTEEEIKYMRKLYDEGNSVMDIIKILFPNLNYKERKNKWSRIKEIVTRNTYKNI